MSKIFNQEDAQVQKTDVSVYIDAIDNDAAFRIVDLNEKMHTVPKTKKEKDLAAMGHPKDKITHKDVLIGRGVLSKEEEDRIAEKAGDLGLDEQKIKVGDYVKDQRGTIHRVFDVQGTTLHTGEYQGKDGYGGQRAFHATKVTKVPKPKDVKEEAELDEAKSLSRMSDAELKAKHDEIGRKIGEKGGVSSGDRLAQQQRVIRTVLAMRKSSVKEEAELDEGSKHAARPRNASRPGTEPAKKGSLQDRIMAARQRMDAKKKDMKEGKESLYHVVDKNGIKYRYSSLYDATNDGHSAGSKLYKNGVHAGTFTSTSHGTALKRPDGSHWTHNWPYTGDDPKMKYDMKEEVEDVREDVEGVAEGLGKAILNDHTYNDLSDLVTKSKLNRILAKHAQEHPMLYQQKPIVKFANLVKSSGTYSDEHIKQSGLHKILASHVKEYPGLYSNPIKSFAKKILKHSNEQQGVAEDGEQSHTTPTTKKEKDLAAMGHPKDKITHKDVLIGRGVIAAEATQQDKDELQSRAVQGRKRMNQTMAAMDQMPKSVSGGEKGKKNVEQGFRSALKRAYKKADTYSTPKE